MPAAARLPLCELQQACSLQLPKKMHPCLTSLWPLSAIPCSMPPCLLFAPCLLCWHTHYRTAHCNCPALAAQGSGARCRMRSSAAILLCRADLSSSGCLPVCNAYSMPIWSACPPVPIERNEAARMRAAGRSQPRRRRHRQLAGICLRLRQRHVPSRCRVHLCCFLLHLLVHGTYQLAPILMGAALVMVAAWRALA